MAKIQLIVSVDDAGELQDILSQLSGYTTDHSAGMEQGIYQEIITITPEPKPEPVATGEQKRKPGRPSKATAAEPAAEVKQPSSLMTEAEQLASVATTSGKDPFAEQIKRSALTAADVKQAGAEYMKTHSVAESMELIKRIAGVEAFAQVPEDKYEELHAALKAG